MIGWLRATLPGDLALMSIGFAYLVTLGFLPWFDVRPFLLVAVLPAYAVYRISAFHPRMNTEYRHWLELMPWDRKTPLPFGPVHLVAQDAIVIAIVIILATIGFFPLRLELTPYAALCWVALFLLVYEMFAVSLMFMTNMDRFGYGMMFVMIMMMYAWWLPWLAFGLMLIAYLIAVAGIRRGYRGFPWGMRRKYTEDYDFFANRLAAGRDAMMSPDGRTAATTDIFELPGLRILKETFRPNRRPEYDLAGPLLESLSPIELDGKGRTERAILNSAWIAWALYAFASSEGSLSDHYRTSLAIFFICVFAANFLRAAIYSASVFPLVNVGTRLLWPRWLVTRYDRSWLTSLAGLLVGILLPLPMIYLGVPIPPTLAISAFIYFGLIQRWGKSFDEWKLTGRGHQRFRYSQTPGQQAIQFNDAILIYLLGFICLAGFCAFLYENAAKFEPKTDQRATVSSGALKLQLLLGANPNFESHSGLTPLQAATLAGNLNTMKVLVKAGAKLNLAVNNPLHLAIVTSQTQTMTELIKLDADVNASSDVSRTDGFEPPHQSYYNVSPLQLAALTGNIPAARILLDSKADPDVYYTSDNPAPLGCAMLNGNVEMARLLISHGAKLMLREDIASDFELIEHHYMIRSICRTGNWEIFKLILELKPDFDTRGQDGVDAFCGLFEDYSRSSNAKPEQTIRIAKWLIEHGADVNVVDADNGTSSTVLHKAAGYSNPVMLAFLLEHGAKIDIQDRTGDTPLHEAVDYDRIGNVKILLDHGAQINVANHNGYTPFLDAAADASVSSDVLKLLLDRGADINATTNEHKNAIQLAAGCRQYDDKQQREAFYKIGILLDAQPNPWARAEQTRLALAAAHNANWDEAVQFLGGVVETGHEPKPDRHVRLTAMRLILALSIVLLWVRAAVVVRRPPNRLAPARVCHGWHRDFTRALRARLGGLLLPLTGLAAPQLCFFGALMFVVIFFMVPLPLEENTNFITVNSVVLAGCVLYGILRASLLHPVFNKSYREWLGTMPWDASRPLPMGPAQLIPKDAIAVAIAWLLTWPNQILFHSTNVDRVSFMVLALICMLGPYVLLIMVSFIPTGEWTGFFVLAFGVGCTALFYEHPPLVLLAIGILYAVADIFLGRAIARFPWSHPGTEPWLGMAGVRNANLVQQYFNELLCSTFIRKTEIGMPQNALVPLDPKLRLPIHRGLAISALAGWIAYVLSRIIGSFPEDAIIDWERIHHANPMLYACPVMIIFCALFRVVVYATGNLPPISFWGRILTARLIIPGYDVIFVVPILAVATQFFLPGLLTDWGVAAIWAYPITLTICLAMLLNLGPKLAQWRLTGAHRIVPKNMN